MIVDCAYEDALTRLGERDRQTSEMERIDPIARYRQMELNDRMQNLARRKRIQKSDSDWRQRQLEAEKDTVA